MDAKTNFLDNINEAEKILDIIRIRERVETGLLGTWRGIRGPRFRDLIIESVNNTIEIALPLLLVFSVSCLEHFLSQIGPNKRLSQMISNWKQKAGVSLTRDVHEARIKRNVIIHSAEHIIDEIAENDARKHGIEGYLQGNKLKLNVIQVKEDLKKLRKFVMTIAQS